jgi:hypothetical protein
MLEVVVGRLMVQVVGREVQVEMVVVALVQQGLVRVELRILVVVVAEAKEQTATIFRVQPAAPAS